MTSLSGRTLDSGAIVRKNQKMEKEIIKLRSYDMLEPTLVHFVDLYLTLIGSKKDVNRMANYICDLMLLCYDSINFTPSLLAASVVYYSILVINNFYIYTFISQFENMSNKFLEICNESEQNIAVVKYFDTPK